MLEMILDGQKEAKKKSHLCKKAWLHLRCPEKTCAITILQAARFNFMQAAQHAVEMRLQRHSKRSVSESSDGGIEISAG